MNLVHYLYRQSPRLLVIATLTSLAGGLAGAGMVTVASRSIASGAHSLALYAMAFFGFCAIELIFRSWSAISLLHLAQSVVMQLRISLSQKVLATPLETLQKLGKSELLVILTRDIDMFSQASQILPLIFGNLIVTVACLGYLAWLSWHVFAIMTGCLLIGVAVYCLAERAPLAKLRQVRGQTDVVYRHFRALIEGSKELQLNARRGSLFVSGVLSPAVGLFRTLSLRGAQDYIWVSNAGSLAFYLVIGLLIFVIPLWLPMPQEIRATTVMIGLYLVAPITSTINVFPVLRQAGISFRKILQLTDSLDSEPPRDTAGQPFAGATPLRLSLRNVSHTFSGTLDDTRFTLGPIDLSVDEGEILFIVGGNGSGKTTLAMLLLGLYEPDAGTIELGGVPVNRSNIDAYRAHFSAVFADFYLFEHLLHDSPQGVHAQATRYIERLGMAHKVRIVDDRFSTVELSTGQRKRLALVSAYLEDRPIYLFDEWAADQDPAFKRVFYTELLPELKQRGKTVIVITHDDGYFSYADRIVKLQDGASPGPSALDSRAATW